MNENLQKWISEGRPSGTTDSILSGPIVDPVFCAAISEEGVRRVRFMRWVKNMFGYDIKILN